jgi:hypothetical protein
MMEKRMLFAFYLFVIKCAIKVTQEPQSGSMCITGSVAQRNLRYKCRGTGPRRGPITCVGTSVEMQNIKKKEILVN